MSWMTFLPSGRYPESFMLISLLEMCQEGGSRQGLIGGFLTGDMEDRVILDVRHDVLPPKEDTLKVWC